MSGGLGLDRLYGGLGNDELEGGNGNDLIRGDGGNDLIFEYIGADTILGGAGRDTISTAGFEEENPEATGFDTIYGGDGSDGLSGIGALYGGNGNDSVHGTGLLSGDAGQDRISRELNTDTAVGGAGNDTLLVADLGGTVYGGLGSDTFSISFPLRSKPDATIDLVLGRAQDLFATETLVGFEHAQGAGGNDTLIGNSGANRLDGWEGNDTLRGGGGNDLLISNGDFQPDVDRMTGGSGNDVFGMAMTEDSRVEITDFHPGQDDLGLLLFAADQSRYLSAGEVFALIDTDNSNDIDDGDAGVTVGPVVIGGATRQAMTIEIEQGSSRLEIVLVDIGRLTASDFTDVSPFG